MRLEGVAACRGVCIRLDKGAQKTRQSQNSGSSHDLILDQKVLLLQQQSAIQG